MANEGGAQAVGPLIRHEVVLPVQLPHLDALRVQGVGMSNLEIGVGIVLFAKLCHGGLEHPIDFRLPAPRRTDQHHTEAHVERLEKLDDLEHEVGVPLQVGPQGALFNGDLEVPEVLCRHFDAREEVTDNSVEEDFILRKELRDVAVLHRPDQGDVLVLAGVSPLQRARHHQDGLQGSHAEVIVVLLRELL